MKGKATKVLTVTTGLTTGGVQRISVNFAAGYARAGRDSRLLSAGGGPMEAVLEAAGVPFWKTQEEGNWQGYRSLLPEIESWAPDAVHIHSQRIPKNVVQSLHELCPAHTVFMEQNVWGEPSSYTDLLDVSCQLTTWGIWAYEQRLRVNSIRNGAAVSPVLVTVPNSVDTAVFYPSTSTERQIWRQEHDIPENSFVMGRIGQSYDGKSHPAPLALVRQLRKEGIDAWLVSVAPADEFLNAVDDFDPETLAHVRILDRIDDPDALRKTYGAFDVFVHVTTQGETFGNVLAEAQACKVPVVTRLTPHRDNSQCIVVENGKTGFVVSKWRKLLDAVRTLAVQPDLCEKMGNAGHEKVHSEYANEVVINRLLNIMDCGVDTASRAELSFRLVDAGLLSPRSAKEEMSEHLSNCYGGLPAYWKLWSRLDGTTGLGFRVARKLEIWRREIAERHLFGLT